MSKQTKHTPGPWSLLAARTLINVKGPRGEQITQIDKTDEANARLIAAAPDLLEACLQIMESARESFRDVSVNGEHSTERLCPHCGSTYTCENDCPMRLVREAVAKAEGRES